MSKKNKTKQVSCLCGSAQQAENCCASIIRGERLAQSAEQLMRSRYTAYALRDEAYILSSWHTSTRPAQLIFEAGVHWYGLKIIEAGQNSSTAAFVEFAAGFVNEGQLGQMHERSVFLQEEGVWYYVDGKQIPSSEYTIALPGRNDPCYCGSGRKFKKCCVANG